MTKVFITLTVKMSPAPSKRSPQNTQNYHGSDQGPIYLHYALSFPTETHMQIYLDTVIIILLIDISLGISECTVKVQVAMDTLVLKYSILKWCCLPTTYIITGL